MFVQLSVALIILIFAITGIFYSDDSYLRPPDENSYDDQDDVTPHMTEHINYWQKTVTSLNLTLGLSAGLGAILTALLSYRFSQTWWKSWIQKCRNFLWKSNHSKKEVEIILSPQNRLAFSSDSKEEGLCSLLESGDERSMSTFTEEDRDESFDIASDVCSNKKGETSESKNMEDLDSNEFVMSETMNDNKNDSSNDSKGDFINDARSETEEIEPQYKTLEARILAVEGNLIHDVNYRMKVFEEQLEEFRNKMRNVDQCRADVVNFSALECSHHGAVVYEGCGYSQGRTEMDEAEESNEKLLIKRYSSKVNLLETLCKNSEFCLETDSKEILTGNISAGDACLKTNQTGEAPKSAEKESAKRTVVPKPRVTGKKLSVYKRNMEKRVDSKIDVGSDDGTVKVTISASAATRRREHSKDKIDRTANTDCSPSRTKQEFRTLLQLTNEKLANRSRFRQPTRGQLGRNKW